MNTTERIRLAANDFGVDPDLAVAIAQVESGMDALATRYEPHYRWLVIWNTGAPWSGTGYFPAPPGVSTDTEMALQRFSWGPLQLMGANFRALGFHEIRLNAVQEEAISIPYSVKFLKQKLDQAHGDVTKALILWNGSSQYPAKVYARMTANG